MGLISLAATSAGISIMGSLSNFPYKYTKIFVVRQDFAEIVNALLQIGSIASGTSPEDTALIYLTTGTVIIVATITIHHYFGVKMQFHQHYIKYDFEESCGVAGNRTNFLENLLLCSCNDFLTGFCKNMLKEFFRNVEKDQLDFMTIILSRYPYCCNKYLFSFNRYHENT